MAFYGDSVFLVINWDVAQYFTVMVKMFDHHKSTVGVHYVACEHLYEKHN
jgi:hypothetical protein